MAIYATDASGKRVKVAGGGFSGGGSGNVPPGGTTGQVLAKASDTDYDTQWTDQTGGGGTAGVSSFNGRTGVVTPQAGDYTAEMVGAVPAGQGGVGRSMAGETVTIDGESYTAQRGAEVFNDYTMWDRPLAVGTQSHAEGRATVAIGDYSHAEGFGATASGNSAHAEGSYTKAIGIDSHAEGSNTTAQGEFAHASGYGTIAHCMEFVIGKDNVDSGASDDHDLPYDTTKTIFIVGNGITSAKHNCFRVSGVGAYGVGAWNSSGADYAELFEWLDGNPEGEDRAGLFVTLEGEHIRLAGPEDGYILGIVSASPSVVGDVYDDQWQGMFVRDVFGRIVYEMQDFPARTVERPGPDGQMETVEVAPAHSEMAPKINPDYDNTVKYQPRTQRPEWDAVGLMGKLVAVDDGTCQPDGYAAVGPGGKATASAERTKYRVMARLDDTHIKIMIL